MAALVFADRRLTTACLVMAASAAGAWRGVSAAAVDHAAGSLTGHLAAAAVVRGIVADSGVPGRDNTIVVSAAQVATAAGSWRVSGTLVAEPLTHIDALPGDTIELQTAGLKAPSQRPGSLSAAALERVGVTAIAPASRLTVLSRGGPSLPRLAQQLRQCLAATVARTLPEPEATLVLGIAFGIHGRLTGAVRTPLQDAGLIHLMAVSGLKVVLVASMVQAVARLRQWSPRRRTASTLAVMGAYLVISGAGPAALRSTLMVGAGLLLSRDGRRPHSFALLGVCAALLLAVEPAVAGDVGFQLSFLGTAGILVLARPLAARLPGPRLLTEPFAVTLAAQLATAPVTAGTFGVLSLVGPFANALALPLLPLIILAAGSGALLGTLVPVAGPALGWAELQVASMLSRAVLAMAQGFSAMPLAALHLQLWSSAWTAIELAAGAAGALMWSVQRRAGRAFRSAMPLVAAATVVAGVASLLAARAATPAVLRVTVLDVGNGVAVLVRPPGGGVVLVDGGGDGAALLTALGRVISPLERHLDAVVLTSTDRSTAAGIPSLVGHYDVSTLVLSQPLPGAMQTAASALAGAGTTVVTAGANAWKMGGVTVRCLPAGPAVGAPCVLQFRDGGAAAVVTGNLQQSVQDELAAVSSTELRSDLMVGPITSAPGSALLEAVRPHLIAVPARRAPPGLRVGDADVAVTGRDSDLVYEALPGGGFTAASV